MNKKIIMAITIVTLLLAAGIVYNNQNAKPELMLATTTSTYDSGLLDEIVPHFEEEYGVSVKITAVGTGQALELGRNGDVDIILVHAPSREMEFVEQGYGTARTPVMYNQFVVVGPESDPAGIRNMTDVKLAFGMMRGSESTFASRGDESGTHSKEIGIWEVAGFDYDGISGADNSSWYLSLGQGMGDTLRTASETSSYALTDEGTFYSMESELELEVMVKGDEILFNQYTVIPINASMHSHVQGDLAHDFSEWLVSPEVQDMIGAYIKNDRQLFTPNAEE